MQPDDVSARLDGIMSFPVTPFTAEGAIDVDRYRHHIDYQRQTDAAALFVACGTGEIFSLTPSEVGTLVAECRSVVDRDTPVVAGAGAGVALAKQMAQEAERAGADGLLALPPYLVKGGQEGLFRYYQEIAAATDLAVIIYQRDNVRIQPSTLERLADIPNIIAFKDGLGDVDLITRLRVTIGDRLRFMNGLPTAELSVQAYRAAGVASYSSAVLNFVPEIASAFYQAVENDDQKVVDRLLLEFFKPFIELRDEVPGYAVSLVKAAVGLRHGPVGDPRPPLVPPTAEHLARLRTIIDDGLNCL